MIVIHFFDLEHLAEELLLLCIVRVEGTVRSVALTGDGLSDAVAEVHVRAILPHEDGLVGAFRLGVGKVRMLHGQPFGSGDDAIERLEAILARVERAIAEWLLERGFQVRPGLIDIGEATPVEGHWAGLADVRTGSGHGKT